MHTDLRLHRNLTRSSSTCYIEDGCLTQQKPAHLSNVLCDGRVVLGAVPPEAPHGKLASDNDGAAGAGGHSHGRALSRTVLRIAPCATATNLAGLINHQVVMIFYV